MVDSVNCAYLDCFSGLSGDMLLGALLDCGLPEQQLRSELGRIGLEPFTLKISRRQDQGIGSTSVRVESRDSRSFRHLTDIATLLRASDLDEDVVSRSLAIFRRLAEAEAAVHDTTIEAVHFHEVGAVDTIVDIVGSIVGLRQLEIDVIHCSPLPLGRGFVSCAHGDLPLPAPAVCELLAGVPVTGAAVERELVTPTGAALAAGLADRFGPLPAMILAKTGYGAGDMPGTADRPNLLRVMIGRLAPVSEAQQVEVIETHLDDWNPETFPYLCEKLLASGALDVSLTPIQMKKGRPGFRLTVLAAGPASQELKEQILSETSAIGLRFRTEQRVTLPRTSVSIETRWGPVAAKQVETPAGPRVSPEYEACRQVAERHRVPIELVYRAVTARTEDKTGG